MVVVCSPQARCPDVLGYIRLTISVATDILNNNVDKTKQNKTKPVSFDCLTLITRWPFPTGSFREKDAKTHNLKFMDSKALTDIAEFIANFLKHLNYSISFHCNMVSSYFQHKKYKRTRTVGLLQCCNQTTWIKDKSILLRKYSHCLTVSVHFHNFCTLEMYINYLECLESRDSSLQ